MTEQKPVKAWAILNPSGFIDTDDVDYCREVLERRAQHWAGTSVIPVTITPGHEAEE